MKRVTFSMDGETLASGGYDGTVRLWATADQQPPYLLKPQATSQNTLRDFLCVDVSPTTDRRSTGVAAPTLRISMSLISIRRIRSAGPNVMSRKVVCAFPVS